jgi:hypothetical protein
MLYCGSTATLGRLTAPHWEGYAASSPSSRWIVLTAYLRNRFSLLERRVSLGLLETISHNFNGLLPALKSRVSDRKGGFYEV